MRNNLLPVRVVNVPVLKKCSTPEHESSKVQCHCNFSASVLHLLKYHEKVFLLMEHEKSRQIFNFKKRKNIALF